MSSRLAFQTQLASIMEVLANAAVAEICKLVDDDYAVVRLQMSQCQRENKALKRKLHLMELKMARGNAERRLRESAVNSSRARVQINPSDRGRQPAASLGGVSERQMDAALWSGKAAADDESPDLELVEPEALLVKEEKVEATMLQVQEIQEEVSIIGSDGRVDHVSCGVTGQGPGLQQYDTQSPSSQSQPRMQSQTHIHPGSSSSSRGVEKEKEPDVVLVKVEEVELVTGLSIQEGLVESSTDDYRTGRLFEETLQTPTNQLSDALESGSGFSEAAALQSVSSQDLSSKVAVQLKDTNTPPSPSMLQQPRSEYSLFDLETFFTRWAPDRDATSTPDGASCSFSKNSAEYNQEGAVVKTGPQPQHMLQSPQGSACSVRRTNAGQSSTNQMEPYVSQAVSAGSCVSRPLRSQAPSFEPQWSGTSAMIRSIPAGHYVNNRIPQQQNNISSVQTKLSSVHDAEKSISGVNTTSRTATSLLAPQSSLPVQGSTAVLASIEVAIAARNQASLLSCHKKCQAVGVMQGDRRRKTYVCRACGKAFSGLSNLEAHERVHTGEKPFCCDTCGKRFSEAGNLKKHQRVHTGEKPFSCEQCGKTFAWICNLRTHQQSATGCGPQVKGVWD